MALRGRTNCTELATTYDDDGFTAVNIGFNFSYFGTSYTQCYVGANSYLTFGAGSTAFSSFGFTSQKGIYLHSGDRSRNWIGVENSATYCRIRYEGNYDPDVSTTDFAWEVTLFDTGVIQIATEGIPGTQGAEQTFFTNGANETASIKPATFTYTANDIIRLTYDDALPATYLVEYGTSDLIPSGTKSFNYWNGSSFVSVPLANIKYWNGSTFVGVSNVRYWDGSLWVNIV